MAPSLLLRPRLEDRALLPTANGLFRGYHVSAGESQTMTDAVRGYGKPMVVDPHTYIFRASPSRHIQKDPSNGKPRLRRTSQTLAQAYGEPFESTVGVRALAPEDFSDAAVVLSTVERVVQSQRDKLLGQMGLPLDPYYDKYRLWDDESGGPGLVPQLLLPPYFYFKHPRDPWFEANVRLSSVTLEQKRGQERVYPVLLFAETLLDDEGAVDEVVGAFLGPHFDGVLLWPNRFHEVSQTVPRLKALSGMIGRFADAGKGVSKLYGGYWSALMGAQGLDGFSCGLGYWSSRNAFAYGGRGGKYIKNYYFPMLRQAIGFDDALKMLEAEPRLRCTCSICTEVYGSRSEQFARMSKGTLCEKHFVNVRSTEMAQLADGGQVEGVRELRRARAALKGSPVSTEHLDVWLQALGS